MNQNKLPKITKKQFSEIKWNKTTPSSPRPTTSQNEIFEWVKLEYSKFLPSKSNVHNVYDAMAFQINNHFIEYASNNDVTITALSCDNILEGTEYFDFIMNGVFLIETKKCKFIHCNFYDKAPVYSDGNFISFNLVANESYDNFYNLVSNYSDYILKLMPTAPEEHDHQELLENERAIELIGSNAPFKFKADFNWDDLILNEKNELFNLISNFFNSKEIYKENKVNFRKNILFSGPDGNGKFLTLKTLISNIDVAALTITSNTDNSLLLEGFDFAQKNSPAILFIEEINTFINEGNSQLFYSLIDNLNSDNGVVVIGTTSLDVSKIDKKLMKPGRFDKVFKFLPPTKDQALAFLKKMYKGKITDAKLKELSVFCVDRKMSFSDIKAAYNLSMVRTIDSGKAKPTDKQVKSAFVDFCSDLVEKNDGMLSKYFN